MPVSVNTVDGIHSAQIVMIQLYAKLMENRIIQDVGQEETEDWTGSALTALPIYSRMILGH